MRLTFLALLAAALAHAAPVPSPKPRKVPPVTPGVYVLVWGGSEWGMSLGDGGDYRCSQGSAPWQTLWRGHWWYDPARHTLHVYESCGDGAGGWVSWSATLDADWRRVGPGGVSVSLRRAR